MGIGNWELRHLAFLMLAALLSGCTVGPAYHRSAAVPSGDLPAAFNSVTNAASSNEWKIAEPSAHLPRDRWWALFQDPELDRLEDQAAAGNQQIAALAARLVQARASVNVARSDLFPHVSATPSYSYQRTSANAFAQRHDGSSTYNTFSVPLEVQWEVDLWGRVRRETEAAQARVAGVADDFESARLALQAEIAIDYFTYRSLNAEADILAQTVTAYGHSADLTRHRRAGGIATDLDVAQAEAQLKSAEAQLPAVQLQRARLLHALAALCGQPASTFVLGTNTALPAPSQVVPAIPSDLLERRPDVAASERRMAAANAEIGVAKAAFYPRVKLTGLAGLQSLDAGTLFDWSSRLWAIGPSIDVPIFTGGRNRAQLAIARAAYDENVAEYRQTVLNAFREVEDQLASQNLLTGELSAETAALAAARRTLEIANNRYKAGLVTFLEVVTAQSAALTHERTVVRLRAERLVTTAALVKAAGGSVTIQ